MEVFSLKIYSLVSFPFSHACYSLSELETDIKMFKDSMLKVLDEDETVEEFCLTKWTDPRVLYVTHALRHMYMGAEHSILKIVGNLQSVVKHVEKERHEFVEFPRIKVCFQSVFTHLQIIRYRLTFFCVCGFLVFFFKLN